MARERINRELIRRLVDAGAPAKQRDIYDDQLTGFGVRVMPKGTISFGYRWTEPGGRQTRITIGRYPAIDAKQARDLVLEEIKRRDHAGDTPAVRVIKHARRVQDQQVITTPTLAGYLDGAYGTHFRATSPDTAARRLADIRRAFPDLLVASGCNTLAEYRERFGQLPQ